jgi:hypothetical protein
MRKPRDYGAELKALNDKVSIVKERRIRQLGELVLACRGDVLPVEQLAGALLDAVATKDAAILEGWRKRGSAFFQRDTAASGTGSRSKSSSPAASSGGTQPTTATGSTPG